MSDFNDPTLSAKEREIILQMRKKAQQNDNLAKARAAAAAKREAKKQLEEQLRQPIAEDVDLAAPIYEEQTEEFSVEDPTFSPPNPPPRKVGGLGVSAARRAQAAIPGTVIGRNERGRAIVIGRDGKPTSRMGDNKIDKFAVQPPPGWSYQWLADEVLNAPQTASINDMAEAGWTSVPQSRHPAIPVRQGGLRLVERPLVLTEEARREEMQMANDQLRVNVQQFMPNDSAARRAGLMPTGGIRKARAMPVNAGEVPPPHVEIAAE
jgi:hypothetical protein